MIKAGQEAGRSRDGALGASRPADVVLKPWSPRTDGKTALLVTERSAVFDRPLAPPEAAVAVDAVVGALGPMPTVWTSDLVHCRLISVAAIAKRLPRARLPADVRSFLGEMQPQDAAGGRPGPLTDEQTQRFDWTMSRLFAWGEINRAILMGVMIGRSFDKISKITLGIQARTGSKGLKTSGIFKRWRRITGKIAEEWNAIGEPIDAATRECWLDRADGKN